MERPSRPDANLFGVRTETLNRRICETRELLTAGHTIIPAEHRLTSLNGLRAYSNAAGITTTGDIKQMC